MTTRSAVRCAWRDLSILVSIKERQAQLRLPYNLFIPNPAVLTQLGLIQSASRQTRGLSQTNNKLEIENSAVVFNRRNFITAATAYSGSSQGASPTTMETTTTYIPMANEHLVLISSTSLGAFKDRPECALCPNRMGMNVTDWGME